MFCFKQCHASAGYVPIEHLAHIDMCTYTAAHLRDVVHPHTPGAPPPPRSCSLLIGVELHMHHTGTIALFGDAFRHPLSIEALTGMAKVAVEKGSHGVIEHSTNNAGTLAVPMRLRLVAVTGTQACPSQVEPGRQT